MIYATIGMTLLALLPFIIEIVLVLKMDKQANPKEIKGIKHD